MIKLQIKLLIVFLLSSFLISFNANAHHKANCKYLEISWDQENVLKKEAEKNARQTYCSVNAKAKTIKKKEHKFRDWRINRGNTKHNCNKGISRYKTKAD